MTNTATILQTCNADLSNCAAGHGNDNAVIVILAAVVFIVLIVAWIGDRLDGAYRRQKRETRRHWL